MGVDKIFNKVQRRTERDLYRKSFRAITKSQKSIYAGVDNGLKHEKRKKLARELLWFFASILITLLLIFIVFELFQYYEPIWLTDVTFYLGWGTYSVYYFLSILIFIGLYITRAIIWALNLDND